MDPNANLDEQLQLANKAVREGLDGDELDRLSDLVLALDEWLSKGGFMPARWGTR